MCLPKVPSPTTVPERQVAHMPARDARLRSLDEARRRRGFMSLIVRGNSSLGPVTTTSPTLGGGTVSTLGGV